METIWRPKQTFEFSGDIINKYTGQDCYVCELSVMCDRSLIMAREEWGGGGLAGESLGGYIFLNLVQNGRYIST